MMEFLAGIGLIVSFLMVVGFFKVWFLVGYIQDRVKAIEGQNREQTQLLAGILRALKIERSGTDPGSAPSPPIEQVQLPAEKGLSLGGYNR